MKFFDSVFLLFVYLSCVFAVSPWSGVAQNVVYSDLIDAGWSQCYSTTYDVATYPKSNYMTPCTQNSIMLACRKVGNPNLLVAAYSPRYTVFGQTYNGSEGLHMMNGVTWYFTEDYSIGFSSPSESMYRYQCDINDGDNKLCWHTLENGVGGYRCGNNKDLLTDTTWEKIILQTNDPAWTWTDGCQDDADCNNYGSCVSTYAGKGCSCYSGFGGSRFCDIRPDPCPFSPVAVNGTNFTPSIGISVAGSIVTIAVSANLEQTMYDNPSIDDTPTSASAYSTTTFIKFGTGSATPCDYPPSMESITWTRNPSFGPDCVDTWKLTVPWNNALSECGFHDNGDHTYSQLVTVSRNYVLPDLSGSTTTRTEYVKKQLVVVFPTSATVSSAVNVTGPEAVTVSAIVTSSYDIGTNGWTVVLKTLTTNPYKLSSPSVSSITGNILSASRYANTAGSISLTDVTACNTNNAQCTQTITLRFSGCSALTGGMVITTTPVCSGAQGATCGAIVGTVSIGIDINNADSCAVVNNIDFSVKTLQSFSDSAVSTPQTLFRASDIAYFGAVVQSTNATLTGFTVRSVCMTFNGSPCQPVVFGSIATGTYNAAFSVNLAQTRYFTTATSLQTFTVSATIDVTWANGKRDTQIARANINSVVGVDLTDVQEETSGDAEMDSSASKISIVTAFVVLIFALLL